MQRTIRNGPNESLDTEAADEARIKLPARELPNWCHKYSTGPTLKSKWLMLRVRNSIFRCSAVVAP